MIKKHNSILCALGIFLLFGSPGCNSDTPLDSKRSKEEVRVLVSVNENISTKVNIIGTAFDAEDTFRFFFNSAVPTSGEVTNVGDDGALKITDYTYSNNKWGTTDPIYWDDHLTINEREFCAILPFSTNNYDVDVSPHSFTIQSDQTNVTAYKKSDLLLARVKTAERLIPLKFWHVMSKVIVNVSASTDNTDGNAFNNTDLDGMVVTLCSVLPKGEITYRALEISESSDPQVTVAEAGNAADIILHCETDPTEADNKVKASYIAIVPPQTIDSGSVLLSFVIEDGKKTYYFKVDKNVIFQQGYATMIDVKLTKSKVELDSDITITGWDTMEIADDKNPIVLKK